MAARFARFARLTRTSAARRATAVVAIGAAAAICIPAMASASPAADTAGAHGVRTAKSHHAHKPTSIAGVQKRLAHLAVRNSQLVERYDQARIEVQKRTTEAAQARRTSAKAAASYNTAKALFTQVVAAQYESGGFDGSGGALLTSSNSNNYLDKLSTMNLVSAHEQQIVKNVTTTRQAAAQAAGKATALLKQARAERRALAGRKASVAKQIRSYKSQLSMLTAKQQATYNRTVNPSVNPSNLHVTAPSAAAQRAVNFAIKQIGKPYVFGASGPGSYDCSGLTMMAWKAGGVSLPHSALEQYNYGTHVSRSQLQPGDLIFFYQPIGHVTIYVGDGMMVSAPETGEDVSLVPLDDFNSDYTGATHIG